MKKKIVSKGSGSSSGTTRDTNIHPAFPPQGVPQPAFMGSQSFSPPPLSNQQQPLSSGQYDESGF